MARFNIGKWAKAHAGKKKRSSPKKVKRKRSNRSPMAKKRKSGGRRGGFRSKLGGFKGLVDQGAKGLGYAGLAAIVATAVAPQYTQIARLGAAFYGGGLPGIAAEAIAGQGMNLLNIFGGATGGGGGEAV